MTDGGYREEVFNVLLALLLHQRGIISAPEQSFKEALQSRRHVPDVLVVFQGMRTTIEGKVADQPEARENALQQARARVDSGIAHIGIAVIYSSQLRKQPFPGLMNALATSVFQVAIYSEAGDTGWTEGGLDYIADLLQRTFQRLIEEDVVARTVQALEAGISAFARSAFTSPEAIQKAAQILDIRELPERRRDQPGEDAE